MPKDFDRRLRVEYRLDSTVNTGDFNNLKPGYTLSADVAQGENPDDVRALLKSKVTEWVMEDVHEVREGV